jgi:peptidoglycan hydrolase CwlO-like protein
MKDITSEIAEIQSEIDNVEKNIDLMPPLFECNPTQERILGRLYDRSHELEKKQEDLKRKEQNTNSIKAKAKARKAMLCAPMTNAFAAVGL